MTSPAMTVETIGDTDVVVTRRFNADRNLVWRAYTEPALVERWLLGPPGWTMPVCEIDLRVGGGYHYRWRNDTGDTEFGFTAEFLEIDAPSHIVCLERPDDMPDVAPAHITVSLVALGDMTELRMLMRYPDAATREMVLGTGMTDGMGMSFDLMDGVLAGMAG